MHFSFFKLQLPAFIIYKNQSLRLVGILDNIFVKENLIYRGPFQLLKCADNSTDTNIPYPIALDHYTETMNYITALK